MPDHIHMLIDLNPSVALSDLMRNIKASTSQWMAKSEFFPLFEGWGKGYYAASLSYEHKTMVIDYIINQEKHHTSRSYLDEMKWLYDRNKLQWYDDDMA